MMGMLEKLMNLPIVASEHGREVDRLMVLLHILMGILVVGWTLYFIFVLIRFRARRNPAANYKGAAKNTSTWLEFGVASFEVMLLIGFAIPLWGTVASSFPDPQESTLVRVIAKQFAWTYIYPGPDGKFGRQDPGLVSADNPFGFDPEDEATHDNFSALNVMHVPSDRPVILDCSSEDVIHSFKVLSLRVTQDCTPGVMVSVHFTPTMEGKFQVTCAQLCGNGHAAMAQGVVVVESPEEYEQWVASMVGSMTSFE